MFIVVEFNHDDVAVETCSVKRFKRQYLVFAFYSVFVYHVGRKTKIYRTVDEHTVYLNSQHIIVFVNMCIVS